MDGVSTISASFSSPSDVPLQEETTGRVRGKACLWSNFIIKIFLKKWSLGAKSGS